MYVRMTRMSGPMSIYVGNNEGIPRNAKNAKELAHVQDFVCGARTEGAKSLC